MISHQPNFVKSYTTFRRDASSANQEALLPNSHDLSWNSQLLLVPRCASSRVVRSDREEGDGPREPTTNTGFFKRSANFGVDFPAAILSKDRTFLLRAADASSGRALLRSRALGALGRRRGVPVRFKRLHEGPVDADRVVLPDGISAEQLARLGAGAVLVIPPAPSIPDGVEAVA